MFLILGTNSVGGLYRAGLLQPRRFVVFPKPYANTTFTKEIGLENSSNTFTKMNSAKPRNGLIHKLKTVPCSVP